GTVTRTGARCVACGTAVPLAYVRTEGKGGRIGARLMAIAAEGNRRRHYLAPTEEHETAARVPFPDGVPDTEIPHNPRYLTTPNYGMTHHADLFTARQLTALTTFSDLVGEARERALVDARTTGLVQSERLDRGGTGANAYADSLAVYLGLTVSRLSDYSATTTTWASNPQMEILRNTFSMQVLSMTWDFAEGNVFGTSSGTLAILTSAVSRSIARSPGKKAGQVAQADASRVACAGLVSTDPPYYDNVGYADLSDYFYIWLRQSLGSVLPSMLATMLTPKADELVADPVRHGRFKIDDLDGRGATAVARG
ncbi:MAG: hypothetical protein LC808_21750, partial [Actinobacteria bacterium]|nr:hypothetical protein [Actinomycetota bacterium]